jgi:hypothetical protein
MIKKNWTRGIFQRVFLHKKIININIKIYARIELNKSRTNYVNKCKKLLIINKKYNWKNWLTNINQDI